MKSILLAEDDISGKYVRQFLEEQGHHVMWYQNGGELADDIKAGLKYDLALVDSSLPGMSGEDIISLSKMLNPKTPVISISSYYFCPAGANAHLPKPFDVKSLDLVVRNHLAC